MSLELNRNENYLKLNEIAYDLKANTITDTQSKISILFPNLEKYIQPNYKDNFHLLKKSISEISIELASSEQNIDFSISVAKSFLAFNAKVPSWDEESTPKLRELETNIILRSILEVRLKYNDIPNVKKLLDLIDNKLVKDSTYALIIQHLCKDDVQNSFIETCLNDIKYFVYHRVALLSIYIGHVQKNLEPNINFPTEILGIRDNCFKENYQSTYPKIIKLCDEKKFEEAYKLAEDHFISELFYDEIF